MTLGRKLIVFRVIGSQQIGMGHVYRALSLAHALTKHRVVFATNKESAITVRRLVGDEYRVEVSAAEEAVENIISLQPNLVVNDILDTEVTEVAPFQSNGIRVVNFEDLGPGARVANVTINELYDEPRSSGSNIRWGNSYFFMRDEFLDAKPRQYSNDVRCLLLAFGGTDQHNLSSKILRTVYEECLAWKIQITIVTGPGYSRYSSLQKQVSSMRNASLTHATGVISKIMEQADLAITSNGRTVYEMAHMNIPALVIPQHRREQTHSFACPENGFVALQPYTEGVTEIEVLKQLRKLLANVELRKRLFNNTEHYSFSENKERVVTLLEEQILDSDIDSAGTRQTPSVSTVPQALG